MRENTVSNSAMLVRTMAKGVAGVPSMILLRTCLLATAMYVMSIMADTKVSKASSWLRGHTYISVENIWYSSNNAKGAHEYIRTAIYLGVIAVVHCIGAGWSLHEEFSLLYARGRNTCDSIDYKSEFSKQTIRLFKRAALFGLINSSWHTNYNYQRRCYEYCIKPISLSWTWYQRRILSSLITLLMLKALVIMTSLG
jgi:hypothetical protein